FEIFVVEEPFDMNESLERRRQRRRLRKLRGGLQQEEDSDEEMSERQWRKIRRMRKSVDHTSLDEFGLATIPEEGMSPPHFDATLADIDAVEGETVRIEVAVSGEPHPEVSFFMNSVQMSEATSERVEIHRLSSSVTMLLHNVEISDEAEIAVCAHNTAGEAWCYAELFVHTSQGQFERRIYPPMYSSTLK
ncbi:hypothetical protein PFISCL1PPCAC_427, partial [Pristionchus fissidentatus]